MAANEWRVKSAMMIALTGRATTNPADTGVLL